MIEDELNIEKINDVDKLNKEIIKINNNTINDVTDDYGTTRDTLLHAINAGSEALEEILDVAKNTDSPRAYEVFATVMKNLADTSDKLLDLHKKIHSLQEVETKTQQNQQGQFQQQNNYYFNGTTSDLQRILNEAEENFIETNEK
jgi:predicted transcriptional regulator